MLRVPLLIPLAFFASALLLSTGAGSRAALGQAPPPIVRPPPPPPPEAEAPPEAEGPRFARLAPDALPRLLAAAARPTLLQLDSQGPAQGALSLVVRPLELAGHPAVQFEVTMQSQGPGGLRRDIRTAIMRAKPFLEPLLLERRFVFAPIEGAAQQARSRLRFDGTSFSDPDGGPPPEFVRSTRPVITDVSVFGFALALDKRHKSTLEVDYMVTAPTPAVTMGARLSVFESTDLGADRQWVVTITGEPGLLFRAVLDEAGRFHSVHLPLEGRRYEAAPEPEPADSADSAPAPAGD